MAPKTTKKSKTAKQSVSLTIAEANRLQSKLRTTIRSTTELTEKKNLDPEAIKKLKQFRKKLQDVNEWFAWNVSVSAKDKK